MKVASLLSKPASSLHPLHGFLPHTLPQSGGCPDPQHALPAKRTIRLLLLCTAHSKGTRSSPALGMEPHFQTQAGQILSPLPLNLFLIYRLRLLLSLKLYRINNLFMCKYTCKHVCHGMHVDIIGLRFRLGKCIYLLSHFLSVLSQPTPLPPPPDNVSPCSSSLVAH